MEQTEVLSPSKQETKHYFTKAQNLHINFQAARKELVDGELRSTGSVSAQFTPDGAGFGRFYTDDPALIKFLDARVAEVGDIFGPDEYQKLLVPAEKRAEDLERKLTQANDLIKKLQAEGKLKK